MDDKTRQHNGEQWKNKAQSQSRHQSYTYPMANDTPGQPSSNNNNSSNNSNGSSSASTGRQIVPQNLFQPQGSQAGTPNKGLLVEFKAGKLIRQGSMIHADKRKGLAYFKQADDGLLHFYWRERQALEPEDDLILFPDEADWLHVPQCTTGRAYMLKWRGSTQQLLFWLQEPAMDAAKEKEWAASVQKLLVHRSSTAGASTAEGQSAAEGDPLMRLLASQGLLQGLPSVAGNSTQGMVGGEDSAGNPSSGVRLVELLTPQLIRPVLAKESLRRRLFPHLPELHGDTDEEIMAVIRSSPFRAAIEELDAALKSGQLGALVQEMGLDQEVAQAEDDRVLAFLKALAKKHDGSTGDGDHAMATD